MEKIFDEFDCGRLALPCKEQSFSEKEWHPHASFEGVELKHLVTAADTGGRFSFHLVKIAPYKKIGLHTHETQLETHEIAAGEGVCINGGKELVYSAGTVSLIEAGVPHEVTAGEKGLCLFAKFIPALC